MYYLKSNCLIKQFQAEFFPSSLNVGQKKLISVYLKASIVYRDDNVADDGDDDYEMVLFVIGNTFIFNIFFS